MASISREKNGRRRILFVAPDGSRPTVRLGKVSQRAAEGFKGRVEQLLEAVLLNRAMDAELAQWVADLEPVMAKKLAKVGLIPKPDDKPAATLGPFLQGYIEGRTDVSSRTAIALGNVRRCLIAYFGADKPLADVTSGDADDWRRYLARPKGDGPDAGQGLGENTVRRRVAIAAQFFRAAVRRKLIPENPFADQRSLTVRGNKGREHFVSREVAAKVLDACPDAEWRLLFALSRYGGLRCPSEHLALRWGDVDWERARIRVTSPKTAHHEGKGERWIPLFPELRPDLEAVYDAAREGAECVITRYRDANANLRTQLERIIRKAGLEPWPKLFQNLRSTRQTELAEHFPAHAVCQWIGNSQAVAREHYLQVTDEHFEKAAQNAAQQAAVSGSNASQPGQPIAVFSAESNALPLGATQKVGPAGLEPATKGL